MKMVLLFCILYCFVIISSFSSCEPSQKESQDEIFNACRESGCHCTENHLIHFESNITWSLLTLTCTFTQFIEFLNAEKAMLYDSTKGNAITSRKTEQYLPSEVTDIENKDGENYSGNKKKTYEAIEVDIRDQTVFKVTSNCSEIGEFVCFENEKNDDLKYITRLKIDGEKLWQVGTNDNPILQLLPNLRTLSICSQASTLEIQLVELQYLEDLHINVHNTEVKLYCAFNSDLCLSNPRGLNMLRFEFNHASQSALKVFGKLKFPKKINDLDILFKKQGNDVTSHRKKINKQEEEDKQTSVFKDIEFDKVYLQIPPLPNNIFDITDFSGITVHSKFTIDGDLKNVLEILPSVYDIGLQYSLELYLNGMHNRLTYSQNELMPFINLKNEILDESLFTSCKYGEKLMNYSFMNEYEENKDKILIIRGFHLKLTQIMNHARNWTTYSSITIIRVYAYNFDVDEEPSDKVLKLNGKELVINYVNVGTTKVEIAGIKTQTYKDVSFLYRTNFQIQFFSMKSKHDADPIFMRAAATCLIMNIGSQNKLAPNSLIKSDQRLSTWYDVIRRSANFSKELYSSLEISRTLAAYKFLEEYIIWRDNQNTNVTRVPFLSLQVLSQNIQILAQAGRDIRDKSNHLQSLASLEEIKTMASDSLKKTLQSVGDAKIAILIASKQKSDSLGDIELRKQNDTAKQINDSQKFIDYLTNEFSNFSKEVEAETKNFKNGVILATSLAVAEAAAEAVNCVLGIFSGGFNPAKALKTAQKAGKLATIIPKLMKVMKTIKNLIQNRKLMGTIFQKVRGAWKTKTKKLVEFFKQQKKILKEWWEKQKALSKMSKKELAEVKKFIDSEPSFFKSTADKVKQMISFIKAARTVKIGFDPGDPLENLATEQQAFEKFKNEMATEAMEQGQKLNAVDVFKWTIAKEHTVGMIDSTLSNDVPEATNYRTALLKLITTGETKTQATIDQAALETSFSASTHAIDLYFEESVSIDKEIIKTEEELESAVNKTDESILRELASKSRWAADLDVEWEKLAIKLEFIRLNEEYCNAYYYFHLEKCQEDLVVNPLDDLEKILSIQSKLLYQSNQNLRQLYPPPQTFTDLTITIKEQKYCSCLTHLNTTFVKQSVFEDNLKSFEESEKNNAIETKTFEQRFNDSFETLKEERNRAKEKMYNQVKTCLEKPGMNNLANLIDHKFVYEILMNCTNDTIENVKKDHQFSYKVDIDSSYFFGRERVRIDEVKVIFKGAKTLSGIVKTYAESTGVSEDRYNDRCYKFIGDKWIRTISYYSKSAVARKRAKIFAPNKNMEEPASQLQEMKEIKDMIKTQSEKIKGLDEKVQILLKEKQDQVTFIDSGNVHESFQEVFRAPTVFTTWLFIIPESRNPGLDLTGLEEIELKFSGSFITTGLLKPVLQCNVKDEDEINQQSKEIQPLVNYQTLKSGQSKVNRKVNDVQDIHRNKNMKQAALSKNSRNVHLKRRRRKPKNKENELQGPNVLNKKHHEHRYHR